MNWVAALIGLVFSTSVLAEDLYLAVIKVKDGDTIETRLTLPAPLNVVSIRLYGVDTPEIPAESYPTTGKLGTAGCIKEAEAGLAAKRLVEDLIKNNGNMIKLKSFGWDKYGGRIDGDAYVIDLVTGKEVYLAGELIKAGLAVEYFGGTKTKDWCQ